MTMKTTVLDSLDLSQFCISEALQEARFRIKSPLLVAARAILLIRGSYEKPGLSFQVHQFCQDFIGCGNDP